MPKYVPSMNYFIRSRTLGKFLKQHTPVRTMLDDIVDFNDSHLASNGETILYNISDFQRLVSSTKLYALYPESDVDLFVEEALKFFVAGLLSICTFT